MIKILVGDLFETTYQGLVCPVNTMGVMGAGLALQFARKYPTCIEPYKLACRNKILQKGGDVFFDLKSVSDKVIIHIATKEDYHNPSRIEWIDSGLKNLVELQKIHKTPSIAMTLIGCGLGGLKKDSVIALIYKYLSYEYNIEIYDKYI